MATICCFWRGGEFRQLLLLDQRCGNPTPGVGIISNLVKKPFLSWSFISHATTWDSGVWRGIWMILPTYFVIFTYISHGGMERQPRLFGRRINWMLDWEIIRFSVLRSYFFVYDVDRLFWRWRGCRSYSITPRITPVRCKFVVVVNPVHIASRHTE